jgi:hypothetical protein
MPNVNPWRTLATLYWELGFNIVPLGADKRPIVIGVADNGKALHWRWDDWQSRRQSAADLRQILRPAWWTQVRGIAGITGINDLVCLDIDTNGHDQLAGQNLTTLLDQLPPTCAAWTVSTPGSGRHLWVRCPGLQLDKGRLNQPLRTAGPDDHAELRYTGHYAALPGSQHPNGGQYTWLGTQPTAPPASVTPDVLLAAYHAITITPPTPPTQAAPPTHRNGNQYGAYAAAALANERAAVAATVPGQRNDQLNRSAFALGQLVGAQLLNVADVVATLLGAAQVTGLNDDEAQATITSGLNAGIAAPRSIANINETVPTYPSYDAGFAPTTPPPADLATAAAEQFNPWPYGEEDGRIVWRFEGRDGNDFKPIGDFTAHIVEEIEDEDYARLFVIVGTGLRGGPFRLTITGEDFGAPARLRSFLQAAVGSLDPVCYKGMSDHLGPAISRLTPASTRQHHYRYHRTGWRNERYAEFLLPGAATADHTLTIELPHKLPYSAPPNTANLTDGLVALAHLLEAVPASVSTPVIAGLLLAPLHRPAGWRNERPGIFIRGRTGSLKTSWTQTAMCLYGAAFAHDDQLIKWGEGATRNAIMGFATQAHDLPLLIDNYKPTTGGGRHDFVNLIHNILEGGDKDRMNRAAQLKPTKPIHCIPIVTGEDIPSDDAAALARVLIVSFPWQRGEPNEHLAAAQAASNHLNAVGATWLTWLAGWGQAIVSQLGRELHSVRRQWATQLRTYKPDTPNILRIAANLAVNELTWRIALQHPDLGPVLAPYQDAHYGGLLAIAQTMSDATAEALEAFQYLNALQELLHSGQFKLLHRAQGIPSDLDRDRMLGWYDDNGVYLLPAIALSQVRRLLGPGALLLSPQSLYSQFEQLGWLATTGTIETTKTWSVGGTRVRVLHLRRDLIKLKTNEEDDSKTTADPLRAFGL